MFCLKTLRNACSVSSQPAPSVPLVLSQCILLVSPASRTYFGRLRSIFKIEKSSLVISVSSEPSAYGPFLPDTCHVHLPLLFISLPWMHQIQYSIHFPTFRQHPPAPWQLYSYFRVLIRRRTLSFFPRRELVKGAHGCTSAALEHMYYTSVHGDPPKTSGPLIPLWLFCLRSIPLLIPDLPHCCPINLPDGTQPPIKLPGLCINDSLLLCSDSSLAYWCSHVISITLSLSLPYQSILSKWIRVSG